MLQAPRHRRSSIWIAALVAAFTASCSKAPDFKGEGKQASLPTPLPPKCPGGVQEVKVTLPQNLADCWAGGNLIKTVSGGVTCSSIKMIKQGCDSALAVSTLAQSLGYIAGGAAGDIQPDSVVDEKIAEGGTIIGCGEWREKGVFYVQMDLAPVTQNECKKEVGKKLFSYCIYSATTAFPNAGDRCTWP